MYKPHTYIWLSRSKDVVFESFLNPLNDGCCHYFGLSGVADKAIVLFNFMRDNNGECEDRSDEIGTYWGDMSWEREYI